MKAKISSQNKNKPLLDVIAYSSTAKNTWFFDFGHPIRQYHFKFKDYRGHNLYDDHEIIASENYCMLYGPSVLLYYDRFIKVIKGINVDLKLI